MSVAVTVGEDFT